MSIPCIPSQLPNPLTIVPLGAIQSSYYLNFSWVTAWGRNIFVKQFYDERCLLSWYIRCAKKHKNSFEIHQANHSIPWSLTRYAECWRSFHKTVSFCLLPSISFFMEPLESIGGHFSLEKHAVSISLLSQQLLFLSSCSIYFHSGLLLASSFSLSASKCPQTGLGFIAMPFIWFSILHWK